MDNLSGMMDTLFPTRCVLALAALALAAGPARGASLRAAETIGFGNVTVRERVGSLDLSFRGRWLAPQETASAEFRSPGKAYALLVRAVVPDDLPGHTVAYSVEVNGEVCGRRDLRTEGVGRRSQFVRIDDREIYSQRTQRLVIRNTAREKLFLESALVLPGYLDAIRQPFDGSDFVLAFLINGARAGHADLKRVKDFRGAPGVTRAISSEIPFAVANREGLKKRIDDFADAVAEAGWPAVPIPISWWAGTPSEVRERLDFQQVCYSKTDTYDEGHRIRPDDSERLEQHPLGHHEQPRVERDAQAAARRHYAVSARQARRQRDCLYHRKRADVLGGDVPGRQLPRQARRPAR